MIGSANEFDLAIRLVPHNVACAVKPRRSPVGIRDELLSRQIGSTQISPRQPLTAYVQLSGHPHRQELMSMVQNVQLPVRYRASDGHLFIVSRQEFQRRPNGGLSWTIKIPHRSSHRDQ